MSNPKPKVDKLHRKVRKTVVLRQEIWNHIERIRKQQSLKNLNEALEKIVWG